eukprot:6753653-Prymnesium_polylepis.1
MGGERASSSVERAESSDMLTLGRSTSTIEVGNPASTVGTRAEGATVPATSTAYSPTIESSWIGVMLWGMHVGASPFVRCPGGVVWPDTRTAHPHESARSDSRPFFLSCPDKR